MCWHYSPGIFRQVLCRNFSLLHLIRRRCEECLLGLKQEFRLSECCSSKLGSGQPLELPFCSRYSGILISWDVGRASLAKEPLEQHGVPSSCSEKLQELRTAWFGPGVQLWEGFFPFELCLARLDNGHKFCLLSLNRIVPKPEPFSRKRRMALSWAEISGRGIAWHMDPCCTRGMDAWDWALYTQNSVDIHISDFSSTRVRLACPWTSATTQQTSTTVLFIQYSVFFQRKICHLLLLFVYCSTFYSQVPACCRKCRGYVAIAHGQFLLWSISGTTNHF